MAPLPSAHGNGGRQEGHRRHVVPAVIVRPESYFFEDLSGG